MLILKLGMKAQKPTLYEIYEFFFFYNRKEGKREMIKISLPLSFSSWILAVSPNLTMMMPGTPFLGMRPIPHALVKPGLTSFVDSLSHSVKWAYLVASVRASEVRLSVFAAA